METIALVVLLLLGAGGAFFAGDIIGAVRGKSTGYGSAYSKEQIADFDEKARKWREEFDAANPDGPPISAKENAAFRSWLDQQTLPAIQLTPEPTAGVEADGSRLGGPVALAEGQVWPVSRQGIPMEFLAQLDFSTLPSLEGFPRDGVLQFFIRQDDDQWGMNIDDPPAGNVAVLYRQNDAGVAEMQPNPPTNPELAITPFWDMDVRKNGIALRSDAFGDTISSNNWAMQAKLDGNLRRPGVDEWETLIESRETDKPLRHHSGGYPVFVQWDFRKPDYLADYDTVLLRLTSDDYLQWGDVGEANFLIRSEDLAKRDFSKVIFWWDCS